MPWSATVRRRRWLAVLATGVTLFGSTLLAAPPGSADDAVVIPDAHFQNCLDVSLGKAEGDSITAAELAGITELYCDDAGIADLTGAKYLTSVYDLSLAGNTLTTTADLKDLGTLEFLNVARNRLTGVDGLGDLTSLKQLYLSENAITSIDDLDGLSDPALVDVSSNAISDLSPLEEFTETVVYADGEAWALPVEVGKATTVNIRGRSGDAIAALINVNEAPTLTVAGAKVTAGRAGEYEVTFADPAECVAAVDCAAYSFNGTVRVVASVRFTATPAPRITGVPAAGETLTARVPDWSPLQLDWLYQWFRGDTAIEGAVASTYTVTTDDRGLGLRVEVTGVLDGYSSPSVTSPTVQVAGPPFVASPAPTISGTAAMGETLTAHVSGWSPTPDSWDYQWYRDDSRIAGAVASTHVVDAYDAGSSLKVEVTGAKAGYTSASATSLPTDKVARIAFTTISRPRITGTATVGKTLSALVSGWSPTPDSWTYQWNRNGAPIPGATNSGYLLVGGDLGKRITVTVTGIRVGNNPASLTSTATRKVLVGTFHTVRPTITGTVQVGHVLTATTPGWAPNADRWSYRWYRNNKPISHATKSGYTLVGSDAGTRITVRMTGRKSGYTTAGRTSTATRKVVLGQFIATDPTITGESKPGKTLRVVIVGWSPTPSTVHRQWYRDGQRIPKETKATYRLKTFDIGHSITAKVTGFKKGYVTVTRAAVALQITP